MILNIGTDRPKQTMQTQMRLVIKSSLIRVSTFCDSVCIFWTVSPQFQATYAVCWQLFSSSQNHRHPGITRWWQCYDWPSNQVTCDLAEYLIDIWSVMHVLAVKVLCEICVDIINLSLRLSKWSAFYCPVIFALYQEKKKKKKKKDLMAIPQPNRLAMKNMLFGVIGISRSIDFALYPDLICETS